MGCDIHGVWECKLPNGTWAAFREINEGRNDENRKQEEDDKFGGSDLGAVVDHEALPALDDVVNEIWVGGHFDRGWRPNAIPMNVPLRDVLGLGPEATLDDLEIRSRIRMVMAFDN